MKTHTFSNNKLKSQKAESQNILKIPISINKRNIGTFSTKSSNNMKKTTVPKTQLNLVQKTSISSSIKSANKPPKGMSSTTTVNSQKKIVRLVKGEKSPQQKEIGIKPVQVQLPQTDFGIRDSNLMDTIKSNSME